MSGKKGFVKRLGYILSTLWFDRKPSSSWFISRLGQSNLVPISSQYDRCRYQKAMSVPTWWSGEVSVLGGSVKAKKKNHSGGGFSLSLWSGRPEPQRTTRTASTLTVYTSLPHHTSTAPWSLTAVTFNQVVRFPRTGHLFLVKSVKENCKKRQPQWKGDPDGFWPLTSGETPQQTATKYNQLILTYRSIIDWQLAYS